MLLGVRKQGLCCTCESLCHLVCPPVSLHRQPVCLFALVPFYVCLSLSTFPSLFFPFISHLTQVEASESILFHSQHWYNISHVIIRDCITDCILACNIYQSYCYSHCLTQSLFFTKLIYDLICSLYSLFPVKMPVALVGLIALIPAWFKSDEDHFLNSSEHNNLTQIGPKQPRQDLFARSGCSAVTVQSQCSHSGVCGMNMIWLSSVPTTRRSIHPLTHKCSAGVILFGIWPNDDSGEEHMLILLYSSL